MGDRERYQTEKWITANREWTEEDGEKREAGHALSLKTQQRQKAIW